MKIERFIILVLLLLVCFLSYNKKPKFYHHQTDHVIEREIRSDQKMIDSLKFKIQELKNVKPRVITVIDSFKVEVEKAEVLQDTSKLVSELKNVVLTQDTLIVQLKKEVNFYDNLVRYSDSVIMNQNKLIETKDKAIDELKSEAIKVKNKRKTGRFFAILAGSILTVLTISK